MKKTDYILPFLWVHGEEESVYREMIQAIKNANIHAFCVESRPHEAFLQDKWWADMDVIIDEAKKQDMRIYILDDKHFPTGYANGAAASAPNSLRRQSVFYKHINVKAGETVSFSIMEYCNLEPTYNQLGFMMNQYMKNDEMHFEDDRLLSATFYRESSYSVLDDRIQDGRISFTADADGEICLVYLTRNAGIHRNYINMLEEGSVRLLIDEVYEKHYAHYSAEFGKTIAGFFSDEPELGNSTYTNVRVDMGDDENLDFPWSESFEKSLEEYMGEEYKYVLPLLWKNNYDKDSISKVRYQFMTALTNQVSDCFSKQIGTWCREHGVEYIGHVIEDNNLHSKTGSSLGHYFKGLKYQTMAGIDDIGGQVLPYQEDTVTEEPARDGAFYHYCLGKLAVSLAQINPGMDGDSMCEIFGNYGWSEGVRLEKYLMDHFMVRGVNHFVPHAFTCSPYPDADCPPHFYAHGNNPQYRHFGELMAYGSRVCERLSGGKLDSPVAILYHAESEWCGERMLIQEPARELYDHQIDYSFLPAEVFEQRDFYNTKIGKNLYVNGNEYKL
ncbi:MAG: hypothetical protein Q4B22_04210, partial [Eubacteriales bacterium]|nr:hypothetical protein [Eubacteriales bacterium]